MCYYEGWTENPVTVYQIQCSFHLALIIQLPLVVKQNYTLTVPQFQNIATQLKIVWRDIREEQVNI